MKENVLDILIYLFEHYMLENTDVEADEETMMVELVQAGFNHRTIDHAFDWLENLAIMCEENQAACTHAIGEHALRHYHQDELDKLDIEARGLLLSLEQCGVLSPVAREMVIDRLMALDIDDIDLHEIKWVILMVLSNCSSDDAALSDWREALVLDGINAPKH